MAVFIDNVAVTSGQTLTFTSAGGVSADNLKEYINHWVSVSGAGSGIVTANRGEGAEAVETLATGTSNTYLLCGSQEISVEASGGDITVSGGSYGHVGQ